MFDWLRLTCMCGIEEVLEQIAGLTGPFVEWWSPMGSPDEQPSVAHRQGDGLVVVTTLAPA